MKWFKSKQPELMQAAASEAEPEEIISAPTEAAPPVEETVSEGSDGLARAARRLHTSVKKTSFSADLVEQTTQQLMGVMQTINQQVQIQQAAIDQAASIISELGAFSQEVTASVHEVGNSSRESAAALEQGKEAIRRSTEFITDMQSIVTENASAVQHLVDQTLGIEGFVANIGDIASQTNLLALNAAIEAARAGAEGRGFAVVANEVKNLAAISAESAEQISRLLEKIKGEAAVTIETMQNSVSSVQAGGAMITATGTALDDIVGTVAETTSIVQEISQAVLQQTQNNERLVQVTEDMRQVLESAAFYIETAAFETEQQRTAMQTLRQVTHDLERIEDDLRTALPAAEELKPEIYYYGLPQDPVTLDPAYSSDGNSNNVISLIFSGLLRMDESGRPRPDIASTWHLQDDGRTYTFRLRNNAYFHNGRRVEAQDVKYTLERLANPVTKAAHTGLIQGIEGAQEFVQGKANEISGIQIKSRDELSITLQAPNLVFLYNLAHQGASIVPQEVVESLGSKFAQQPCGAGAFIFSHWRTGEELVLTANERFHEGCPYLDSVHCRIYSGADALEAGFLNGEVGHARLDGRGYDKVKQNPLLEPLCEQIPPVDNQYCGLVCSKPPFDNKLVRQAVNHAIDRASYLQQVLEGHAIISQGPLPPSLLNEATAGGGYDYNLSKAQDLMRQAGYGNGYPETVILHVRANNTEQAARAEYIAAALAKIGIQVEIVVLPWTEMLQQSTMEKCNMYLMAAIGGHAEGKRYLDQWFHSRFIGASNYSRYSNSEFDGLIEQAETVANPEQRRTIYNRAFLVIQEDAPWIFLFHPIYYLARQPYVKGLRYNAGGTVFAQHLWLNDK